MLHSLQPIQEFLFYHRIFVTRKARHTFKHLGHKGPIEEFRTHQTLKRLDFVYLT